MDDYTEWLFKTFSTSDNSVNNNFILPIDIFKQLLIILTNLSQKPPHQDAPSCDISTFPLTDAKLFRQPFHKTLILLIKFLLVFPLTAPNITALDVLHVNKTM